MTAEIAILNKSAAALAADSAVTIGNGTNAKIYNTVNKIFEISQSQPLGAMVYGNLQFMDLPIEVILKRFRSNISDGTNFTSVAECLSRLLKYLENEVTYTESIEMKNVFRILYESMQKISSRIDNEILNSAIKTGRYLPSKTNGLARKIIRNEIDRLEAMSPAYCFDQGQIQSIGRRYGTQIDNIVGSVLRFEATKATEDLLRRLARFILHREELSAFRTGVVIVGFGNDEICPTLATCEIDGIVNGKLKSSRVEVVDIDREGLGADVRAFAQREMVERFLQGVDPAFDSYVQRRLEGTLKELAANILQSSGYNTSQVDAAMLNLDQVFREMVDEFQKKSAEHKDREYRQNVLNMVQFMPNQELATLAESLVDLTSLKRRMSAERETVGGAIDVAVISKSDGFVWIKRKHYFPADLNPRFFTRHFRDSGLVTWERST